MSDAIVQACSTPGRRSAARPFVGVGAAAIVLGGLVAGVAQIALGFGQGLLAERIPSPRLVAAEFGCWNVGNAAVIVGTLTGITPLVDVGGVALVTALTLFVRGVRSPRVGDAKPARSWPLHAFRALIVVLVVSIPVGLVLAQLRAA